MYTFALDANEPYPQYHTEEEKKPVELAFTATKEEIKNGDMLYNKYCAQCHGRMGDKGGAIPNLAYSKATTFSIFEHIVLKGMFISKGMPDFSNTLSAQEVKNIKNYILFSAENM
ncbi:MAG: cytochrome c [Cyclobacteriaceae bacterium]